jgi:tetratricopeptide (TPR) repeat protein
VSENIQRPAQSTYDNPDEGFEFEDPEQSNTSASGELRPKARIEAVQADVADAAALRSQIIQAMRQKLESGATSSGSRQAALVANATPPERASAKSPDRPSPLRPLYPLVRAGPPEAKLETKPSGVHEAPTKSHPSKVYPLAANNSEVWDEALYSAQRVETALARLSQALAQEEQLARKNSRTGLKGAGRRPGLLRIATLFLTSFMIGISTLILAYDWRYDTSVEKRLTQTINGLLPAKKPAIASNEITLPSSESAEKPLAAELAEKPLAATKASEKVKSLAMIRLETFDAEGSAGSSVPLSIRAISGPPERSFNIRLTGLPAGATLPTGRLQKDGSWLLKSSEQKNLRLQLPSDSSGNLVVTVEALDNSGDLAAPPQEIKIKVTPAKTPPKPATTPRVAAAKQTSELSPLPIPDAPPSIPDALPEAKAPPVNRASTALDEIEEAAEAPAVALGISDPSLRLMARGDALMELGDVASARSFYDRAFDLGNLRAARSIARTYDPIVLAAHKVQGMRADPAKALEWYRKAEKAGEAEATQAIAVLENFLGH